MDELIQVFEGAYNCSKKKKLSKQTIAALIEIGF